MSVKSGAKKGNEKIIELETEMARVSQQNDALATQLTDAQIALCELYESVVLGNG